MSLTIFLNICPIDPLNEIISITVNHFSTSSLLFTLKILLCGILGLW